MKLWVLRAHPDFADNWPCDYDTYRGFVVRAESEQAARDLIAHGKVMYGDIGLSRYGGEGGDIWLDPKKVECVELTVHGGTEVILRDFRAG